MSSFYSPISREHTASFLIFRDIRHRIKNVNRIIPIPSIMTSPTGTVNAHFTIPILLKNKDISGLITTHPTASPTVVDKMIGGIKEIAVWTISCLVVKPKDFIIP